MKTRVEGLTLATKGVTTSSGPLAWPLLASISATDSSIKAAFPSIVAEVKYQKGKAAVNNQIRKNKKRVDYSWSNDREDSCCWKKRQPNVDTVMVTRS